MNSRKIVGAAVAAFALGAFSAEDYVRWVDPLVGTTAEGNCVPGATMPFGMVQASPDSGKVNHRCSGFDWKDEVIRGFSQTHANGTGGGFGGDGFLMPYCGETDGLDFSSAYDKKDLTASPDYFRCALTRYGITAEVTASKRVGWYRFTYPKAAAAKVLVDASEIICRPNMIKHGQAVKKCELTFVPELNEVRVVREVLLWAAAEGEGPMRTAFVYRFDRPWKSAKKLPTDRFVGGERWTLDFGEVDAPMQVQVAMSSTGTAGAKRNLDAETAGATFESVRTANRAAWNAILARMTVEKGSEAVKKNWYTSLFHLCIQPNLYSDVDGLYYAENGKVRPGPKTGMYTMFSLWDTFRAAHPLYTLLVPEMIDPLMQAMLAQDEDHGHLPIWILWGQESHDMIGVHSIPVLVDAWAKGWRGVDGEKLLDRMVWSLSDCNGENVKNGFNLIYDTGYISYNQGPFHHEWACHGASVSRNLEISYDWWCVAKFARMIGNEATARRADRFAASYKQLFDPATGFFRARSHKLDGGGKFRDTFFPLQNRQVPGEFWGDYTEANAYIYNWHVFQDPLGLAEMMGGVRKAEARLDEFFNTWPDGSKKKVGNNDEGGVLRSGQIGQLWHGNEPSHHTPYFYTLFGRPDKAAAILNKICDEAYLPTPDGLCGNDDCGQMSAWYLFTAMGFYPFNPAGEGYVFGAPQAEEMKLTLPNGKTLVVRAKGFDANHRVIAGATLNGEKLDVTKPFSHEQLLAGGELAYEMGE